jgi:3-oxoacyl-[acyl-carrier-protein] synthase II
MSKRRVVVTGLGIVSPVGNSVDSAWQSVTEGRSGIGPMTAFDTEAFSTKIAGEIRDLDVSAYLSAKEARRADTFIHYGMAAAIDAISDAGIENYDHLDRDRVGFAIAAGIGGLDTIEKTVRVFDKGGPRKVTPFFIPSTIINMVGGNLSIRYGYRGPNIAIVTACTTATHNIGEAARMIQYGDADVMVAGGAEYATTPTAIAGFSSAKALSTRNDDPEAASRPWDEQRDGFVLSNGAGIVVLEEMEQAKRRGANIYAEVTGFGMSGDAYHMTSPPEGGDGAARCMTAALKDAGINPDEVDYINAHGTSTQLGDRAESDAVKTSFGEAAHHVAISSTKSMTGHLLGAAGGVEAIFCLLAMRDNIVPPTINLENPSPGCDLDYVPLTARDMQVNTTLSNSFGFGGTNGSLVFSSLGL